MASMARANAATARRAGITRVFSPKTTASSPARSVRGPGSSSSGQRTPPRRISEASSSPPVRSSAIAAKASGSVMRFPPRWRRRLLPVRLDQQTVLDGGDDRHEAGRHLLAQALLAQEIGRRPAGDAVDLVARADRHGDGVDVALPFPGNQAEAIGLDLADGGLD